MTYCLMAQICPQITELEPILRKLVFDTLHNLVPGFQ